METLNKKLHMALVVLPVVTIVLLYTTTAEALIIVATGATLGLTLRLWLAHKKNSFVGTSKLDWGLLAGFMAVAVVMTLAAAYTYLPFPLAFVAVRALIVYFKIYGTKAKAQLPK